MTAEVVERHVTWRGANLAAYDARDPEILLEGPAGTGKTFCILHKLHDLASDHPGFRGLIVRKVAATLGSSVLPTLEEEVYTEWDNSARRSKLDGVRYYGGSEREAPAYVYDNGSRISVGGMDQASKVLGSFYDVVFYNQAEESTIEDIETLKTRLRHGLIPHNRLYLDCNPSYDRHPLLLRAQAGLMRHLKSTLRDNPRYYDADGNLTQAGREYLDNLEGLTGTRRQRLLLGEWVGMENAIYADLLDAEKMLVPLPERVAWSGRGGGGMDYGRIHLSAVCALTEATDGHVWVREVWAKPGGDREEIRDAVRSQRLRFKVHSGVADPIQEWAAQDLGWKVAKSGAGSRKGRIESVRSLLSSGVLRFDLNGEGVMDLWAEMQMYRYEVKETDTLIDDVVVRKDDDRVAALEYAVEGLMAPPAGNAASSTGVSYKQPEQAKGRLETWRRQQVRERHVVGGGV